MQRAGFGLLHSSINTAVMRTLPDTERSMGAGLHNLHRGIGMAFGVALCSMMLEKRLAIHQLLMAQQHERFAPPITQTLTTLQDALRHLGNMGLALQTQVLAALYQIMQDQVRMAAYTDCFTLLALLFMAAFLPAWLIRRHTVPAYHPSSPVPQAQPEHVTETTLVTSDNP